MQNLSINHLIVYVFLAIILYISLRAGRGMKDIQDYAIANKSFGTGAWVLTLCGMIAGVLGALNAILLVGKDY